MAKPSVAVLLPTYNEEEGIGKVIDAIRSVSREWRLVVVDSGSKDKTVEIAKKRGVEVMVIPIRGKGIAIKKAFEAMDSDYVFQIDSDITYPADAIPGMIEKLKTCDVVIGSRFRGKMEDGAMTGLNKIGNVVLSMLASAIYFQPITDVCSGLWGFRKKAYKGINITAKHFELECDMFAECVNKGFKICEVPINYGRREGETKLSPIYGFIDAWHLLKKRIT